MFSLFYGLTHVKPVSYNYIRDRYPRYCIAMLLMDVKMPDKLKTKGFQLAAMVENPLCEGGSAKREGTSVQCETRAVKRDGSAAVCEGGSVKREGGSVECDGFYSGN
jgi:hypothetical protein